LEESNGLQNYAYQAPNWYLQGLLRKTNENHWKHFNFLLRKKPNAKVRATKTLTSSNYNSMQKPEIKS